MYEVKAVSDYRFNVFLGGHLVAAFSRIEQAFAWIERRTVK